MLRELFNAHRWRDQDLDTLEIRIRHRGAPGDEKVVHGFSIDDVGARGLMLSPTLDEDEPTFIPFHRILSVTGPDGLLWERPAR